MISFSPIPPPDIPTDLRNQINDTYGNLDEKLKEVRIFFLRFIKVFHTFTSWFVNSCLLLFGLTHDFTLLRGDWKVVGVVVVVITPLPLLQNLLVWCESETEGVRVVQPYPFLPIHFFPYYNQPHYLSPLVVVRADTVCEFPGVALLVLVCRLVLHAFIHSFIFFF